MICDAFVRHHEDYVSLAQNPSYNTKMDSISDGKAQFDLMGSDHYVHELTMQCLQNDSGQRPEISKVVFSLETLQSKFLL